MLGSGAFEGARLYLVVDEWGIAKVANVAKGTESGAETDRLAGLIQDELDWLDRSVAAKVAAKVGSRRTNNPNHEMR